MKPEKITLFLHIGQPKTGTSAIQGFLNYNRKYLVEKYKILYPNFNEKDQGSGLSHNHAQMFIDAKLNNKMEDCVKVFSDCQQYCNEREIKKIVISSEGFAWGWWPVLIKEIISRLDLKLVIILYLRRQDNYLESAWKQWGHKYPKCDTIQQYAQIINLDWNNRLEPWLELFDPKDFIVRPYEKPVIGDNVVFDFIKILGIHDVSGFAEPPLTNENINAGFNRDIVEILRLSKDLVKDVHDHRLLEFMDTMLSSNFKKSPLANYGFLSPTERLAIIKKYSYSNSEISKTFFGDEKEPLFQEPLPELDETFEAYTGLTLEKVVPIFMEIFIKQHREIQKIKKMTDK